MVSDIRKILESMAQAYFESGEDEAMRVGMGLKKFGQQAFPELESFKSDYPEISDFVSVLEKKLSVAANPAPSSNNSEGERARLALSKFNQAIRLIDDILELYFRGKVIDARELEDELVMMGKPASEAILSTMQRMENKHALPILSDLLARAKSRDEAVKLSDMRKAVPSYKDVPSWMAANPDAIRKSSAVMGNAGSITFPGKPISFVIFKN